MDAYTLLYKCIVLTILNTLFQLAGFFAHWHIEEPGKHAQNKNVEYFSEHDKNKK